jgi:hypothetical protein
MGMNMVSALREEHRLKMFENRVLRIIFGPKWSEVTGGWRQLYNEELHNLYSLPSIIRMMKSKRMRSVGHVVRMREKRNACRILLGKPEGKRPLGRPNPRRVDYVVIDLRERMGWYVLDLSVSG